ncbi:uncharacterized protein LOC125452534 [Stegostoma tigrinum]|uniref:uncharacterized protein LOC125452534 n=1 Tax=Stegostoma tigrinum TaxID=3053191 RepID=UPI00202B94BC|nr:uncharacterized protein LOC125452534 [Stegostoma tigrinum]
MGGGGSKWRRVSVAASEPIRVGTEGGGSQLPGQEGKRQQREHHPGSRDERQRKGESLRSAAEEGSSIEQELDRALAECWLSAERQEDEEEQASADSCLSVRLGQAENAAAAGRQWESLLSCSAEPFPRRPSGWRHATAALSSSKLDTRPRPTHELVTISTQDLENNNLANRFHINGKNTSQNSTPILYDYFEEELMASIVKEYS